MVESGAVVEETELAGDALVEVSLGLLLELLVEDGAEVVGLVTVE